MQEFSVPPVVSIDPAMNLTDVVWGNADEAPETVQFSRRTPDGWRDVTCAAFRDEVRALAKGLVAAGIQHGSPRSRLPEQYEQLAHLVSQPLPVRLGQGLAVIDPIPCHGHHFSFPLQLLYIGSLILRQYARFVGGDV